MATIRAYGRGNRGRARRRKLRVAAVVGLLLFSLFLVNSRVLPLLTEMAEAEAVNRIEKMMAEAATRQIASDPTAYEDLVHLTYRSDGLLSSLEADVGRINLAKSRLSLSIVDALDDARAIIVGVPLGNLFGINFLSGRGPQVRVRILLAQQLTTRLESDFSEQGINQTRHRILLAASIRLTILLPAGSRKVNVTQKFCIAETILLGDVPDAYTKIHRLFDDMTESEIDDVYDFGAGE